MLSQRLPGPALDAPASALPQSTVPLRKLLPNLIGLCKQPCILCCFLFATDAFFNACDCKSAILPCAAMA
jgi:hypothetical protein